MRLIFSFIFIAVVIVDQLIKYVVRLNLKPVGKINVIPKILNFVYVENSGAAFGILSNQKWLFVIITLVVIIGLLYKIFKDNIKNRLFLTATSLVLGGAVGNLIDRIAFGYVVDYIHLSFFPPVCNFADYCVTIGAIMFFVYIYKSFKNENIRG